MNKVILSRKIFFSAGGTFRLPDHSDEENVRLYGRLAKSSFGTGFNYCLEAFFAGQKDPVTGLVINLTTVDQVLKKVISDLDHKNLSFVLPLPHVPTPEGLATYLWEQLSSREWSPAQLIGVRLYQGVNEIVEVPASWDTKFVDTWD